MAIFSNIWNPRQTPLPAGALRIPAQESMPSFSRNRNNLAIFRVLRQLIAERKDWRSCCKPRVREGADDEGRCRTGPTKAPRVGGGPAFLLEFERPPACAGIPRQ